MHVWAQNNPNIIFHLPNLLYPSTCDIFQNTTCMLLKIYGVGKATMAGEMAI
jgi:hypothetical protein